MFGLLRDGLKRHQVHYDKEPVYTDFRRGDVRHSEADISKARRLLATNPRTESATESPSLAVVFADCPSSVAMNFLRTVDWYQLKLFAEHSTGVSMDALHVIAGVAVQLLVAAVFRTSVARPLPLLAVLALAILNEANDLRIEIWPDPGMQFGEAVKDIVLTLLVPMLIFVIARRRPKLLAQTPS